MGKLTEFVKRNMKIYLRDRSAVFFSLMTMIIVIGPIFACIVIAVIPIITFYLIFHEKVQDGMMQGALKG